MAEQERAEQPTQPEQPEPTTQPTEEAASLHETATKLMQKLIETIQRNGPAADAAHERAEAERDARITEELKKHMAKRKQQQTEPGQQDPEQTSLAESELSEEQLAQVAGGCLEYTCIWLDK